MSIVSTVRETVSEHIRGIPRSWLVIITVAVTILFLILPVVIDPFSLTIAVLFLFAVIIAESWNMLAMTGYINFGHTMFIGIGAFTAGQLVARANVGSAFGPGVVLVVLLGGLVSMAFALLIGYPLLQLEGAYFAIAALGVAEALSALFLAADPLRGSSGILMPTLEGGPIPALQTLYYLMFVVALVTVLSTYAVKNSKLGYGFRAIRLGEDAAEMLGVPTTRYSILAFSFSGFFAGVGGAVYAYWLSYITAPNVFEILLTIEAIVITMIGGIGTVLGPLIGAAIYTFVVDFFLDTYTTKGRLLLTGFVIVVIVLTAPGGLVPAIRQYLGGEPGEQSTETKADGGETDGDS